MDTKRVLSGTIVWFLGFIVPVLHHALLMGAAVQEDQYGYSYHSMVKYFFHLPWLTWIYIAAMALVGGILVVSGIKGDSTDQE